MLWAACEALAELSPVLSNPLEPILPRVVDARAASYKIAIAVLETAIEEGLANVEIPKGGQPSDLIDSMLWYPRYLPMHLIER